MDSANSVPSLSVLAHIETIGDVWTGPADSAGRPGSRLGIEGFALRVAAEDLPRQGLVYAGVQADGVLTPWLQPEEFCGTRGQNLALRGFCVLLRSVAAWRYRCLAAATFTDGTRLETASGLVCVAPSGAPLESLRLSLSPRPFAPHAG